MRLLALIALVALTPTEPLDSSEVRRLSLADDHVPALEAATALIESPGFAAATEVERAEAWFTVGVARHRAESPALAVEAFLSARDLAGPGRTRQAAMYDVGTILLEEAERVRATIPEVSGAGQVAPIQPGGPGSAATPEDEPAPDPLEVARAGYRGARSALIDRLRIEAGDGDTRANLELIVRRLRELDEIEREREEQQQEQEQDQQQDQEPSEDSEDESQSGDEQGSEDQQQEQEQSEDESSDEEQSPEEEQPPEEQPPEDQESEGEPEEQPAPEEQEEELMSAEEIQRLMDRLREIEEQARAVQAMLRRNSQVPVEKDW